MKYKEIYLPTHPLADKQGKVFEHRMVLSEKLGLGDHPCHWCSKILSWHVHGWEHDALCTDHIDENPLNNHPENLVASCRGCNALRGRSGHSIQSGELFFTHKNGTRQRAETRICRTCQTLFLSIISRGKKDGIRGQYCSRPCIPTGRKPGGKGLRILTEDQVRTIRIQYLTGAVSQAVLARIYSVSQMTISKLLRRETWTHIS